MSPAHHNKPHSNACYLRYKNQTRPNFNHSIWKFGLVWFGDPFGNPFGEGKRVPKVKQPGRVPKHIAPICFCFAATQLARQLQQERTQVVCSNMVARKGLARRHSRNSCHTFQWYVSLYTPVVDTHSILKCYFLDLSWNKRATAWLFHASQRDNVVYWKTKGKINNDLQSFESNLLRESFEFT